MHLDWLTCCRRNTCAGPILASGRLPSKHIANVVVSLARQKHLSPALVAAARDLLQTKLNSCNGQDVSQILFGLMLDKHSVPDAAETFRVIAPALAQHLRSDETFQVPHPCPQLPQSRHQRTGAGASSCSSSVRAWQYGAAVHLVRATGARFRNRNPRQFVHCSWACECKACQCPLRSGLTNDDLGIVLHDSPRHMGRQPSCIAW